MQIPPPASGRDGRVRPNTPALRAGDPSLGPQVQILNAALTAQVQSTMTPANSPVTNPNWFGQEFELTEDYREKLDEIAEEHYQKHEDNSGLVKTRIHDLQNSEWLLDSGAGRDVIVLPEWAYDGGRYDEYVVKLALPTASFEYDGTFQNQREAHIWNHRETITTIDITPYLVPVTMHDEAGYWVIMPKGEICDLEEFTNAQIHEYNEWAANVSGVLADVIWDEDVTRPDNVVTLDGEFKLCDYGVRPQ